MSPRNPIPPLPGQMGSGSVALIGLPSGFYSLSVIDTLAVGQNGAESLSDLINIQHLGKNIGQLGLSYGYLEICYLKFFCQHELLLAF